jgi:hypothetical protein
METFLFSPVFEAFEASLLSLIFTFMQHYRQRRSITAQKVLCIVKLQQTKS